MAVEKTIVYRLEGADGQGVYHGCHAGMAGLDTFANTRQPAPWQDGLDCSTEPKSHRFGFQSPEQLKHWFNAYERRDLSDVGVVVKVFEVSKGRVKLGRSQLTFNKRKAKLIGIKSLQEI